MKKNYYLLFTALFLLFSSSAFAQEEPVFQEGDVSVNAGVSLGLIGYGFGYGSAGFSVPVTLNVDYGIHEYIGVGPYLGYMRRSYGVVGSRSTFTAFSFGGQAIFHFSSLLNEHLETDIDDRKVDFYGKLILGFQTYSWRDADGNRGTLYDDSGDVDFGPVFGVRYMFSPNFGGYVEGGRGNFGWLTIGGSLKL